MPKITFMGAGSTIFAKSLLGDCLLAAPLQDSHIALYDIDPHRLAESKMLLDQLNRNINEGRATITTHCGIRNRKAALRGAHYVINAIQVGGYKPSTVIDFGLRSYSEIKRRAAVENAAARKRGGKKHDDKIRTKLVHNKEITHSRTIEYASRKHAAPDSGNGANGQKGEDLSGGNGRSAHIKRTDPGSDSQDVRRPDSCAWEDVAEIQMMRKVDAALSHPEKDF